MHVCKYTCMHVYNYASILGCKYAIIQVCKYESMHVWNDASIQLSK